jgi:hypothetical protein
VDEPLGDFSYVLTAAINCLERFGNATIGNRNVTSLEDALLLVGK